jgi:hypothetical protein
MMGADAEIPVCVQCNDELVELTFLIKTFINITTDDIREFIVG